MLKDEQKSAKTLPQRLAGLNKGRGAWGENLACGMAWQSVLLGRNGAWQSVVNLATHNTAWCGEFDNETAKRGKIQRHSNKIQHNEFIKANIANGTHSTTNSTKYGEFGNANSAKRYFVCEKCTTQQAQQIQCGKPLQAKQRTTNSAWQAWRNGQVFAGEAGKAKMGQCLGGGLLSLSLSLSRCSHFLARLWAKFKGLFYSFHRSFNSSFCLQKAFFRALCFFKIFKYFVFGLFALVIASRFRKDGVASHKF